MESTFVIHIWNNRYKGTVDPLDIVSLIYCVTKIKYTAILYPKTQYITLGASLGNTYQKPYNNNTFILLELHTQKIIILHTHTIYIYPIVHHNIVYYYISVPLDIDYWKLTIKGNFQNKVLTRRRIKHTNKYKQFYINTNWI